MGTILIYFLVLPILIPRCCGRVRSEPGLMVSEKIHLVWAGYPKCGTLSYWIPTTASLSSYPKLALSPEYCVLANFYENLCSVLGCSWEVLHDYLWCWLLILFCFWKLPFTKKEKWSRKLRTEIFKKVYWQLIINGRVKFLEIQLFFKSIQPSFVHSVHQFTLFIRFTMWKT